MALISEKTIELTARNVSSGVNEFCLIFDISNHGKLNTARKKQSNDGKNGYDYE